MALVVFAAGKILGWIVVDTVFLKQCGYVLETHLNIYYIVNLFELTCLEPQEGTLYVGYAIYVQLYNTYTVKYTHIDTYQCNQIFQNFFDHKLTVLCLSAIVNEKCK